MPSLRLRRRREEKKDPLDHPRFDRVRPFLRGVVIAFLVLRLVTTVRQIRRQIAKLRGQQEAAAEI
jgi:hypothetical protein